jgi:transcriptional regulator with XRE-family HTH domain
MSERGFKQEQIAKQLGVTQKTISIDLENYTKGINQKHAKTKSNPKGAGRRKGQRSTPTPHKKQPDVATLMDVGLSVAEIAAKTGIGKRQIRHIVERVAVERAAEAKAEAQIDRNDLSLTAQQKFDTAIRQHTRKLDTAFEQRVQAELTKRFERAFPMLQQEKNAAFQREQTYREFMQKQKKIMAVADFTLVLSCLHPDSRASVSEERLKRAFQILQPKKFALTGER